MNTANLSKTDAELRVEFAGMYAGLFALYPDHPVMQDSNGVVRWVDDPFMVVVRNILKDDVPGGLNTLHLSYINGLITVESWSKFHRDTGWSLSAHMDSMGRVLGLVKDE